MSVHTSGGDFPSGFIALWRFRLSFLPSLPRPRVYIFSPASLVFRPFVNFSLYGCLTLSLSK